MVIIRCLLVANLVLVSIEAAPQDFSDLFSVYAENLNTPARQYYTVQYVTDDATQPIAAPFNVTEEDVDFEDDYDFVEDDDDGMEEFFYENGFVEVSNDDVYDYSYTPNKSDKSVDGNSTKATSITGDDNPGDDANAVNDDEKYAGNIVEEQTLDDKEDDVDVNHTSSSVNQSTMIVETSSEMPVIVEEAVNSADLEHETNYDNSLNPDLMDHIIPAFVHPINRPSNEWPLNETQIASASIQSIGKPIGRPPNRRRRPQGNRRPQQGGRPNKKHRKRRKPQNGVRRPIKRRNNKTKRKRPVSMPHKDPNFNNIHKFFAPGSCPACQCGVTTTRRIVGGTIAAVNEFPWLALIAFNGTIQCGGTLINDRYVLTAAHCVRGFAIKLFQIRFLEYNRAISSETPLVIRTAARIFSLNSYNANSANNDVAIIRLSRKIEFATTTVRPICLPPVATNFVGDSGIIAGWGTTSEDGNLSRILRKAKVPIISNAQCLLIGMQITNNMLCAGRLLSGGIDACQGDSGGPLMVVRNRRYYLAGIVSWGDGCARPLKPGVYTRVTNYLPWIRRISTGSCSCF